MPAASLRWPRLTRLPLALEIALALLLKVALLLALWHAFFSHPQAEHMQVPTSEVERHLLATPASAAGPDSTAAATTDTAAPPQPETKNGSH